MAQTVAEHTFTADEEWDTGIRVSSPQLVMITLAGTLGSGGSLRVKTRVRDGVFALPNARYTEGMTDALGDSVEVIFVRMVGRVILSAEGTSGANMQVQVLVADGGD